MDTTVPLGRVRGTVTPPCSKSYAQRALAASLLAEGRSVLRNIEFCDDTRAALDCIQTLGARIVHAASGANTAHGGPGFSSRPETRSQQDAAGRICSNQITGNGASELIVDGGLRPCAARLNVGESGLATRLFTPVAALWHAPILIEGRGTLLTRPMDMMLEPLRTLGAQVHAREGRLPLEVCGPLRGGEVTVDGSLSSQFVTGLLLALPLAADETTVRVLHPVSTPYIDMTIDTAARFGIEIHRNGYEEYFIEGKQRYEPAEMDIEGDWSAAAMLLVAGATAGEVCVRNISMLSKQADTAVLTALERAGAGLVCEAHSVTATRQPLRAFTFDATHCPDLFPALAALAASTEGVSVLRGTRRLAYKESNRAQAICTEYAKLGIEVNFPEEDIMTIRGGAIRSGRVSAQGDHRMAMSLAVAGLRSDGAVEIEGAECVSKSYPRFFSDLERIRC